MENNLRVLMAIKKVGITQLAADTKIARTTLYKMYYEKSQSISYEILRKLCDYFECTPNDLLHTEGSEFIASEK